MRALLLGVATATLLSGCAWLRVGPPRYEPATLASGLVIADLVVTTVGPRAKDGDRVAVHYEGRLADGTVFDSSYDRGEPLTFELGAGLVPPGLDQGLVGLRLGGKRQLTVPAELGYGADGIPGLIPPDATLSFEIELMGLTPPEAPAAAASETAAAP